MVYCIVMFVGIGQLLASAFTLVLPQQIENCGVGWAYQGHSIDDLCLMSFILAVIPAGSMDNWYSRVKDEIKKQQEDPVWMSEDKVTVMFAIFLFNIFHFFGAQFCFSVSLL